MATKTIVILKYVFFCDDGKIDMFAEKASTKLT